MYHNFTIGELKQIIEWSNTPAFVRFKLEKDFLLSLILAKIGTNECYKKLIFKGGTCLNKCYFPYFRLSEDLDFVVNIDNLGKVARRTLLVTFEKAFVADLSLLGMTLKPGNTRLDDYKLEMMTFEYRSILDNSVQTIKIDISLKKNLKLSPVKRQIHTIFVDKILEEPIFGEHFINCIDLVEAVAEKIRAGLTRTYPAIRDFFDIWFIKKNAEIDFTSTELKALVNTKLADVNYAYTISEENFSLLEKQIITDLKPVLSKEWLHFSKDDLREVYDLVMTFSGKMVE